MHRRCAVIALTLLMLVGVVALAACARPAPAKPASTPASGSAAQEGLPETNASRVIQPADGGIAALKDGVEISIPRDALSAAAVVGVRAVEASPRTPIPRSLIGRAYQFSVEGGALTGVARIRLPLPSAVISDQYEAGAYRWNGKAWERVPGRVNRGAMELNTNVPNGIFAVQGQWRMADAAASLTVSSGEPGRDTVAITVTGQYRYSALPVLQNEYVPARLTLKVDTSGGTGQISGDDSVDQTVAEALLWFKPDPAQAQAVIPFTHLFDIEPARLDVEPGRTRSLYAVLAVDDGPAATRRASSAADYTQILPIRVTQTERASGTGKKTVTEAVRPALAQEPASDLRWHVRFNGMTMAQVPASGLTLPLDDYLALGGLGEYRVTLETVIAGVSRTVSNEIPIVLAIPGTPTPTRSAALVAGAATTTPGPVIGTPTPGAPAPATPTRRTPPGDGTPTATLAPPATATPGATATPTRPSWASVFWADRYVLTPGECTTLHWDVQNVISVHLNDEAVTGNETREVCPEETTTYTLSVAATSGGQNYHLPIAVQEAGTVAVVFYTDSNSIVTGHCTQLYWETSNVSAVYLNDAGVAGVATKQICPTETTTYKLRVESADGSSVTKSVTVEVLAAEKIVMHFWAEQYSLPTDTCTYLHWSVENVSGVYLQRTGGEDGVAGFGDYEACPAAPSQVFTLRAETSDGRTDKRTVTLHVLNPDAPNLKANEVIAQGVVNDIQAITMAGNQPGFKVMIDGIYPLFTGSNDCCQTVVGLEITQAMTAEGNAAIVDWPVNPGQFVEFRALCTDSTCSAPASNFYFRLHLQ